MKERANGRQLDQIRTVNIVYNMYGYAEASVLFEIGNTKVLCSVHLQPNVPPFLRGQNSGWLTAEYAMLPSATINRIPREAIVLKRNSRSVEISRFIGRTLRSVIDFSIIPDRTILIDCDVLQADGGTRTACITASYLALQYAQKKWIRDGTILKAFLIDELAAVSVAIVQGIPILDPDFQEDSSADGDFNFVLTKNQGNIVEIQGGVEKRPISWQLFDQMRVLAFKGVRDLYTYFDVQRTRKSTVKGSCKDQWENQKKEKMPLFSLKNRIHLDS